MKTVIIGGGKGALAIIELAMGAFLTELALEVECLVDRDPNASGMAFAREHGIRTSDDMDEAMALPGLELIIELTGDDSVLDKIYKTIPAGVKLIDHTFAHIFWDLVNAREDQKRRVRQLTELEERIEKERHFLQSLVDNIPDLIVVLDRNKRAIEVNDSFSKFAGISREEAIGRTCEGMLSTTELGQQCKQSSDMLDQVLKTGMPHSLILRTAEPHETHWEITRTPIKTREGETEAILGTWHRITERVLLKREVEAAEQRFKSFINSAKDWISIKDLDGRYVIVNPSCAADLNRHPDDFTGRRAEELLSPAMARLVTRNDRKVIDSDKPYTYDEVYDLDGREHIFQTVRFPLKDYKNSTIGVCTIARDITSEKQLRGQLVQAAKLAAVGKLAAGVAHEINNPLTGILAYAEDLADELDSDDPKIDDVKVIIRETMRCRNIVRNLLDFARQEDPELQTIGPNEMVGQALSLVERLPQFRNINIERSFLDSIPTINGDSRQLQQVILNLMLNAADAVEGKGIIELVTEYDRRHDQCVISVKDNGPGIPENLIDKIFEPFFSTKGTNGLGLAVSWGIVERHHGTIEVDTVEVGGAIFRIVLPAHPAAED